MSRFMMKEREPLHFGLLCHFNRQIDGAVPPALARLGAREVLLRKILCVVDQQIRAASKLDDFGITPILLFDVRGIHQAFVAINTR